MAQKALLDGIDVRRAALAAKTGIATFAEAAKEYIAEQAKGWTNAKHADQWTNTLDTYAMQAVGQKLMKVIDTTDLLAILRPIWETKIETAIRVRNASRECWTPSARNGIGTSKTRRAGVAAWKPSCRIANADARPGRAPHCQPDRQAAQRNALSRNAEPGQGDRKNRRPARSPTPGHPGLPGVADGGK